MFGRFDFLYLPSRNVAADASHLVAGLGGELIFAIERFETRVAMIRVSDEGPDLLLAEHLTGDKPVSVFRVDDLTTEIEIMRRRAVEVGEPFEIPFGQGVEVVNPGPQRIAIYQRTQAARGEGLRGRVDFEVPSSIDAIAGWRRELAAPADSR